MRINKQFENAITIIKELNMEQPVTLGSISIKHDLSLHFLDQIARKLRKGGLIVSRRGPDGGYCRARKDINLWQLTKLLEGKLTDNKELKEDLTLVIGALSKTKI